jgi:hypothetical protein
VGLTGGDVLLANLTKAIYYYTLIERENLSGPEIHIQLSAILVHYSRHLHIQPI